MDELKYPIGKFDATDEKWSIHVQNIDYIANYPKLIIGVVSKLNEAQMQTPYRPGGWTVTQLVHHIADSHMNAYIRFKLSLTETDPTIKPYNESEWAKLPDSNPQLINSALILLEALHIKWATLMKSMSDQDWNKRYHHPEDKEFVDLSKALKMYHWHSAHHLAHITCLIQRENW